MGGAGGGGTAGADATQVFIQVHTGAELADPCPGFNQPQFSACYVPGSVLGAVVATVKSRSHGLPRAQSGLGEMGTRKAQCHVQMLEGGNLKCAMAT